MKILFYKQTNQIKCEKLIYETLEDTSKKLIKIFDNGEIIDSLRVIKGDSIYIHYKDLKYLLLKLYLIFFH